MGTLKTIKDSYTASINFFSNIANNSNPSNALLTTDYTTTQPTIILESVIIYDFILNFMKMKSVSIFLKGKILKPFVHLIYGIHTFSNNWIHLLLFLSYIYNF